jgi:hypothetical protein
LTAGKGFKFRKREVSEKSIRSLPFSGLNAEYTILASIKAGRNGIVESLIMKFWEHVGTCPKFRILTRNHGPECAIMVIEINGGRN